MSKSSKPGIRDKIQFYDLHDCRPTADLADRATAPVLKRELEKRFPGEVFEDIQVAWNRTGVYQAKAGWFEKLWGAGRPVENLPDYVEVTLRHQTGSFWEELTVWSPVCWNDRFAGTAGGGTGIGGRNYLTRPDNCSRGWTVPFAVCNGFTAATMYAGNIEGWHDHTIDTKTGELNRDLYENWRLRSTHNMTRFGKAIAEILHNRPVKYAYMNGGSGGGRQCLMEVQNYPEDYNGVWASCPAIYWNRFLLAGFWPLVVMNEHRHFLPAGKNAFFLQQVHEKYGGDSAFYHMNTVPQFDARSCIGMKAPGGRISEADAEVMNEIWRGPHRHSGEPLWYGFAPGVRNWQVLIPIGTYYYPTHFSRRVTPFILGPLYARWITGNPKQKFGNLSMDDFVALFDRGETLFGDNNAENTAIDGFVQAGGKLIIDHGTDDPLIPTEGTWQYVRGLVKHFGSQQAVDSFCRLYINPGDNHGNCWGNGPGITQCAGLQALIAWVENGTSPDALYKVRINSKTGEMLEDGYAEPVTLQE